jgi:hypothetical protein
MHASPDFKACKLDSDCIAVPRAECCSNGRMEAVSSKEADAYERSFTCPDAHPICAMIRFIESRVPLCDNSTRECSMVAPQDILCGGFVRNPHQCPEGWSCDASGRPPDVAGKCVRPRTR